MSISTYKLTKLNDQNFFPIDVFICSSSFEERCFSIPKSLNLHNVSKAFILEHINIEQVKENAFKLKKLFGKKGKLVPVSTINSILTADSLKNNLLNEIDTSSVRSIVIDITTFTHESLLILLKLVASIRHHHLWRVYFLYTSASEYSTDKENIAEKWLSNGVASLRNVLGFSGDVNPLQKTHLIMFVGYESSRSTKIIEMLEPSIISLGYGEPGSSTAPNHEEASHYFHTRVTDMATKHAKVHPFSFSCSDLYKVKEVILKQSKILPNSNVVIAPMNTKISTLGVGLAALECPEIQLCYAPALQYNFSYYSKPGDSFTAIEWID